jgi:hypothetical protein
VIEADGCVVTVETDRFAVRAGGGPWQRGDSVDLCIRPERILLLRPERVPDGESRDSIVTADLVEEVAHGAAHTLYFRVGGDTSPDGHDIEVDISSHVYEVLDVRGRRRWSLAFPRPAVHVMSVEEARGG